MKEKKLTNGEISEFCKSLSLLFHAGIGLGDGLFLMAEDESGEKKEMLEEMGRNADLGTVLSDAMEEYGGFPAYVTGMVKVGEATGRLEEALLALSEYYEGQERMNRKLRQALTYPSMLMLMILAVIGVLLIYVLPMFEDVYASLGGHLTGIGGGLLKLGELLKTLMPAIGAGMAAAVFGCLLYGKNEAFRLKVQSWWQRHCGDKGVSRMQNDARFAQALAMGLKSGLPIEEAIRLAGGLMKENRAAEARCRACIEGLERGESLADVMKNSNLLPASACRMLELGMRGGNGDRVMDEIAKRLMDEAGYALEQRAEKIEPAMVMTASLLVGFILVSVMLPLMNIMTAIG